MVFFYGGCWGGCYTGFKEDYLFVGQALANEGPYYSLTVAEVVREGEVRTYDMGGSATTLEMAEAIAGKL